MRAENIKRERETYKQVGNVGEGDGGNSEGNEEGFS